MLLQVVDILVKQVVIEIENLVLLFVDSWIHAKLLVNGVVQLEFHTDEKKLYHTNDREWQFHHEQDSVLNLVEEHRSANTLECWKCNEWQHE